MAIEYRRERKRWGFRFSLRGLTYKRYDWRTQAEARQAEAEQRVELSKNPPLPRTAFVTVVAAYLVDSATRGRSKWRLDALERNFRRFIVPFFGELTAVTAITHKHVEQFIAAQSQRGVKNNTVWHYTSDLRACLNYAIREGLLRDNPVKRADKSRIKNRKVIKPPLDPHAFDLAAEAIEHPRDRAWFNVVRYVGLRKDEGNRLEWADINFDLAMIHIRGSKTEGADVWLPLAPVALQILRDLRKISDPNNPLIFPGRSAQSKGIKVYDRQRLFRRIQEKTGIKLMAKDLRDYFCNEIAASTRDPAVLMRLMRHQSLETTTKYLRTISERMTDAVKNLGAGYGGGFDSISVPKPAQNDIRDLGQKIDEGDLTGEYTSGISEDFGIAEDLISMPHGDEDKEKKH